MKKYLHTTICLLLCMCIQAQTYDENEKEALRKVLRIEKTDINWNLEYALQKNFELFGLTEADTLTWYTSEEWIEKMDIFLWNNDSPKRIVTMNINTGLKGVHYDLSPFTELENLDCSIHRYGLVYFGCSFDISKNKKLKSLSAYRASFTDGSFSEENNIEYLHLREASYPSTFDLSKFPKLKYYYGAPVDNYDFFNCPLLEVIYASIPCDVDLSKNTKLKSLFMPATITGTRGGTLNLAGNMEDLEEVIIQNVSGSCTVLFSEAPNLKEVQLNYVSGGAELQIDWGNLNPEKITISNCYPMDNLDLSHMTNLKYLECTSNGLKSLNIPGCVNLEYLNCRGNSLTSLDLPENNNIKTLICGGNFLEFSDLPLQDIEEYNYISPYGADNIAKGSVCWKDGFDLSKEYNVDGYITNFTWGWWYPFDDGSEINLVGENGKFELTEDIAGKTIYCEVTNERFPGQIIRYIIGIKEADTGIDKNISENQAVYIQSAVVNRSDAIVINSEANISGVAQLYNMQGQAIGKNRKITNGITEITAPDSAGIYLLAVSMDNGEKYSFKVIIR